MGLFFAVKKFYITDMRVITLFLTNIYINTTVVANTL